MIPGEILKKIRQIELRTNRSVIDVHGALSVSVTRNLKPIESDGFGNCGEFATIKNLAGEICLILIPPDLMDLETQAIKP